MRRVPPFQDDPSLTPVFQFGLLSSKRVELGGFYFMRFRPGIQVTNFRPWFWTELGKKQHRFIDTTLTNFRKYYWFGGFNIFLEFIYTHIGKWSYLLRTIVNRFFPIVPLQIMEPALSGKHQQCGSATLYPGQAVRCCSVNDRFMMQLFTYARLTWLISCGWRM